MTSTKFRLLNLGEPFIAPFETKYWNYSDEQRLHPYLIDYKGVSDINGIIFEVSIKKGPTFTVRDQKTDKKYKGMSYSQVAEDVFRDKKIKKTSPETLFGFGDAVIQNQMNRKITDKIKEILKWKTQEFGILDTDTNIPVEPILSVSNRSTQDDSIQMEEKPKLDESIIIPSSQLSIIGNSQAPISTLAIIQDPIMPSNHDDDNSQDLSIIDQTTQEESQYLDHTPKPNLHETVIIKSSQDDHSLDDTSIRNVVTQHIIKQNTPQKPHFAPIPELKTPPQSPILFKSPSKKRPRKLMSHHLPDHSIEMINREHPVNLMKLIPTSHPILSLSFASGKNSRLAICTSQEIIIYEMDGDEYIQVHSQPSGIDEQFHSCIFHQNDLYIISQTKNSFSLQILSVYYENIFDLSYESKILNIVFQEDVMILATKKSLYVYSCDGLFDLKYEKTFDFEIREICKILDTSGIFILTDHDLIIWDVDDAKKVHSLNHEEFPKVSQVRVWHRDSSDIYLVMKFEMGSRLVCGLFLFSLKGEELKLNSVFQRKPSTTQTQTTVTENVTDSVLLPNYLVYGTEKGKIFVFSVKKQTCVGILMDLDGQNITAGAYHPDLPLMALGGTLVGIYHQKE